MKIFHMPEWAPRPCLDMKQPYGTVLVMGGLLNPLTNISYLICLRRQSARNSLLRNPIGIVSVSGLDFKVRSNDTGQNRLLCQTRPTRRWQGKRKMGRKRSVQICVDSGPGYRVYFALPDSVIILILLGGDKSSQERDIKQARAYWESYEPTK